jgi:hypothetical protein
MGEKSGRLAGFLFAILFVFLGIAAHAQSDVWQYSVSTSNNRITFYKHALGFVAIY